MKDKKGFTLVELLAVIAILAVLVIIALPNVLKLFRNAKQNTFVTEVQNLVRSAEDKYLTSSILNGNNTCFDSKTNPLDMSGRENINYLIKLTNKGKVIEVKVMDDSYQLLINNENGINKADIGNKYKVESRNKTTDILDCNNSFLVQGEEGTGEENAPYKIQYIDDLVKLSSDVASGQTFEGKTFILSRNLDFKNKDSYKDKENSEIYTQVTTGTGFTPIGYSGNNGSVKPFKGTFDGKNHTIDNLYIYNNTVTNGYLGLFSRIDNGKVLNLKVNGKIKTDITSDIGGIVGNLRDGTIENCISNVSIESLVGKYSLGGIVGWVSGNNNTIKNSINNGPIKNGGEVGGIVGYNESLNLIIDNCTNNGNIENNLGLNLGGIMGSDYSSSGKSTTINNCVNNGKIITNFENEKNMGIGGIVGSIAGNAQINNTHNIGNITNETKNFTNAYTLAIGGIIGRVSNSNGNCKINSSYNTGNIYGGNSTGGILGESYGNAIAIIDKCYNSGEITSNFIAGIRSIDGGGIIGYTNGGRGYILNSYNLGKVISTKFIGGLIGYTANTGAVPIIINSYNKGDINLIPTSAYNSGIISSANSSIKSVTLNNVFNLGNHLNSTNSFGISYFDNVNTKNYEIQNVYYKNDIVKKGTSLSNDSELTIGKSESEMKNATFVSILNTNKNNINLSSIDSELSSYSLCDWKLGTSGYPELDCK